MAAIVAERTPLPDSTEPIPAPLVPDDVCRALDVINTPLSVGLSSTYRELFRLSLVAGSDVSQSIALEDAESAHPQQPTSPTHLLALLAINEGFVGVCICANDNITAGEALYEHYRTSIATIMTTLGISAAQVYDESRALLQSLDERPEFMLPQYSSSAE